MVVSVLEITKKKNMEIGTYTIRENEIDKHNYTYKNMTDEEIQKQAERFKRNTSVIDAGYSFARGAEWAKEHPSEETINKFLILSAKWHENTGLLMTEQQYIKEHWNDD